MTFPIAVQPGEHKCRGSGIAARRLLKVAGGAAAQRDAVRLAHGQPRPASGSRQLAEWQAQHHPRFRIGDGDGQFLSRDGQGVVTCPRQSWFGTEAQASVALKCFASARGMRALRVMDAILDRVAKTGKGVS